MSSPIAGLSATLIATIFSVPAQADPLAPVLVTATRTPAAAAELLASVDWIDAATLAAANGVDLGDLLQRKAGLEAVRLGGAGQQTSLFLRGTDSNHVLVLVDGVRVNPATIGTAAIQNIAPELVERVEIVKGPRSTLYGSDAIGGVINVITRSGAGTPTRVQLGSGRHDSHSASFSSGWAAGPHAASLGLSWVDSRGFPTRRGDGHDRGFSNRSLALSGGTELGGVTLGARLWHASGTAEYSDFFITPLDQDFENTSLALDARFSPRAAWDSRLGVARMIDELGQNQSPDRLQTRRWQLDWQNDIALGQHHVLTAGLLLQQDDAHSQSFGTAFSASTTTGHGYLQDQVSLGRHRLLLAVGHVDHETFGGHQSWNAEYGLALGEATLLSAGAGSGFRAPDATDLYGFGGNTSLKPERSRSYELALRHAQGRHQLSLALFRNEISQLIEYVVTDFSTFDGENRNVGQARIDGLEANWRYQGETWSLRAAATLQDPRNRDDGSRLLRRARETLSLGLARRFGAHEVALDVLAAGSRQDFGFPAPARLPGYVTAGVSASMALGPQLTLLARLENLFDEDYELARGYNTLGRALFVTLRYERR